MLFSGYKVSNLCIYMMNFAIAWDSFATFLTIWLYWTGTIGYGNQSYGVVFALYALAQAVGAPFLGYWADKMSIRTVVLASLMFNIVGNAVYVLASCSPGSASEPSNIGALLLITGRLIAGGSAGCIILGLSYVTQLSSEESRIKVMNYYRVFGFIGRFFSALISIGFLFVPEIAIIPGGDGGGHCYIAPYTLPPVTTFILDTAVLIFAFLLLKNPPAQPARIPFWKDPDTLKLFKYSLLLNMHFWAGCITMWTIFSQIIPISIIVYGVSSDPKWFWLPYVPFFLGLVTGWASVLWPLSRFFTDRQLMLLSPFVMVLALVTYIQFDTKPPQWIFYVGTTVLYTAFNIFNTAFQSYYSKVIGKTIYINTLMSTLLITGAFGQFCGPFLTTFFMQPVPTGNYPGCVADSSEIQCCPSEQIYTGCTFQGINFLIPLVMLIMLATTVFQYWFIRLVRPLEVSRAIVVDASTHEGVDEKSKLIDSERGAAGGATRIDPDKSVSVQE